MSLRFPALVAAIVLPCALFAQSSPAQVRDPVVVTRGTAEITLSEIDARVVGLPKSERGGFMNSPKRIEQTLQTLLLEEQLADEALELGLDKDPLFAEEVALATKQILARRRIAHFKETLEVPDMEALAKERYLANPEKFAQPERLDLRHVLIKAEGRTDEEARALAEKVRAMAVSGEKSFKELVAEYTDESRVRGARSDGRLPNTIRGAMVPEFEEAAFALKEEGEISPVVKTPFGYHVIILDKRKPAVQTPYEKVREAIIADLEKKYSQERQKYHTDVLRNIPLEADPELVASLRTRYIAESAERPAGGDSDASDAETDDDGDEDGDAAASEDAAQD